MNSIKLVFSFLFNTKKLIEKESEDFIEKEIFKIRYNHFLNTREFIKKLSKRVFNEIENSCYTYKDLLIYLLYMYGMKKICFNDIKLKNIKKIKNLFSLKQFKTDADFVVKISKKLKLKNINDLFEIRESGKPIIYELIKRNYITAVFFVKFYDIAELTCQKKDIIINKEYHKFFYAMKSIRKLLITNGGLYGKEKIQN